MGSYHLATGKLRFLVCAILLTACLNATAADSSWFEGKHYRGRGDVQYLQLLETARRVFEPDPEFQSLPMLYDPDWNGFLEGPTWKAWWIQNSYGTTYCALPFYQEPLLTFLQNAQDLWFDQMGDGHREGCPSKPRNNYVAPDGLLCDAALPGCIIYKQGDGRREIHDWALEFTAAGVLLQSELLLISRDHAAIAHYLPLLERAANLLDTRRDPKNNLFLAGPAANLLGPSYAGWARPDGTYGKAYLTGLSITYIAALDRLIELEKLAGATHAAAVYAERRELARKGLPLLTTDQGYFIKSLDPDGTRHGVFGAPIHGYFEAPPNHDAIAFRVVDEAQAKKIYAMIASIPGLRPYGFILPNYPSLDDMYTKPVGMWRFGEWVNGGEWSTCEARMILAYYRMGKFDDARRSMEKMLTFARRFRMDNPLADFGNEVYQPNQPINITYDAFGPSAAMLRGLFEYLYRADGLTLIPHIPPGISELQQLDPVRFGTKRLFLATVGHGPVTSVRMNGKAWRKFNKDSIFLPYAETPDEAHIVIARGGSTARLTALAKSKSLPEMLEYDQTEMAWQYDKELRDLAARMDGFQLRLKSAGFGNSYEAAHARLIERAALVARERHGLLAAGKIPRLPEVSEAAADKSYIDAATALYDGLAKLMKSYAQSSDERARKIAGLWNEETAKQ